MPLIRKRRAVIQRPHLKTSTHKLRIQPPNPTRTPPQNPHHQPNAEEQETPPPQTQTPTPTPLKMTSRAP